VRITFTIACKKQTKRQSESDVALSQECIIWMRSTPQLEGWKPSQSKSQYEVYSLVYRREVYSLVYRREVHFHVCRDLLQHRPHIHIENRSSVHHFVDVVNVQRGNNRVRNSEIRTA
jgi:hypothetical protein